MKDLDTVVDTVLLTVFPVAGYVGYAMLARLNANGFSSLAQIELPMADWIIAFGMLAGILFLFKFIVWPLTQAPHEGRKSSEDTDFPFIA